MGQTQGSGHRGGGGTAEGSKFSVPRDKPGKYTVEVRTKSTGTVATVDKITVWIVWAEIKAVTELPIHSTLTMVGSQVENVISGGYSFQFTISPTSIVTDPDRPDLGGANAFNGSVVNPPGAMLLQIVSGQSLAGGANTKWDVSRRIRVKVENPSLYTPAQMPSAPGGEFNAQPTSEDVPVQYPATDSIIGNDDRSTGDENNDPYSAFYADPTTPDVRLNHEVGQISSWDSPNVVLSDRTGSKDGETFEVRDQFGEFVRLLIGDRWYQCSDFVDWKAHLKIIRKNGG